MDNLYDLESIWDRLLSRQEDRIRGVYAPLSAEEQEAVITHLEKMANEPDWHIEQRKSAEAALKILQNDTE